MKILLLLLFLIFHSFKQGRKIISIYDISNNSNKDMPVNKNEYPNNFKNKKYIYNFHPQRANNISALNKDVKINIGNTDTSIYPEKVHPNNKGNIFNNSDVNNFFYSNNSPYSNGNQGNFSNVYNEFNNQISNKFHGKLDIYNFHLTRSLINTIFRSINSYYKMVPMNINVLSTSSRFITNKNFEAQIQRLYLTVQYQKVRLFQIIDILIHILEYNKPESIEDIFEFYRVNRKFRLSKLRMVYYKRTDFPFYQRMIYMESLNFKRELNTMIVLLKYLKNFMINFIEMVSIVKNQFPLNLQDKSIKVQMNKILNMIISMKQSKIIYKEKINIIKSYYHILKTKRRKFINIFDKMFLKFDEYNCILCIRANICKLILFLMLLFVIN